MPDQPTGRDLGDDLEPRRLDDLELERTMRLPDEDGPRASMLPHLLVGLALLASALLAAMFFLLRTPKARVPAASPAPAVAGVRPGPAPSPAGPLPTLADSDALARALGAALSTHPDLPRWLGATGLLRRLAAAVTNVAEGETPRPHLEFLAPARPFGSRRGPRGRVVADPAGFAAYDTFGDVVASIDARAAAAAYRSLEPLLDEAHRELGHPEGQFRRSLDRALAVLIAAPVPPEDAALVPHATLLRYADPALEGLTPAQKQLLRAGPRNVRLVQAKLREIQAALGPAPSP